MWKLTEKKSDFTYWKSVFMDIFCSLQSVPLDTPEIFLRGHAPDSTWSLRIGFGCNGVHRKKMRFFKGLFY
jgi:hypothetical protein